MKNRKRYLSFLLAMILLIPMTVPAESANLWKLLEQAQIEQDYLASTFWLSQWEGEINAFDRQDNPLDIEESMRIGSGTVLETAEESLAVVDMDRERLAIMDEISRVAFENRDFGDRIAITLQSGAMYFRVGRPLEDEESFEVNMGDILLAIRGTCGMVQQNEDKMSVILASGHATITQVPEDESQTVDEPAEITIEAGESVSVTKKEETVGAIVFEKKKLTEAEVPPFLVESFRKDPQQLEKVYEETSWEPEKLFGDNIPVLNSSSQEAESDSVYMDYYRAIIRDAPRYDYYDNGEGAVRYQYALVYMEETDTIPALLLAEVTLDAVRYVKVFQYDPDMTVPGTAESMERLDEYRKYLYLRAGGRGLLQWYNDGESCGILQIHASRNQTEAHILELSGDDLWYGPNDGSWPSDISKEDISWIDI